VDLTHNAPVTQSPQQPASSEGTGRPPSTTIMCNGTTYACPFADAVPPLTPDEESDLRSDISRRGVVTSVLVSEDHEVLDGHHRMRIAAALGQPDVPIQVVPGLSAAEKRALAIDLNLKRRHLTARQKRALVAQKLKADPTRSNNSIAREVGVSDKTAGAVRADLEESSEIPKLDRRQGLDGRTRSVKSESAPVERPVALEHTRGRGRGPYPWWPELRSIGRDAKEWAENLLSLRRTKISERTLEPVNKLAGQFRGLVERLNRLIAVGDADCV
jgi:hypothetical protein